MNRSQQKRSQQQRSMKSQGKAALKRSGSQGRRPSRRSRPAAAFRQRGASTQNGTFDAPEVWHEPVERDFIDIIAQNPGTGYIHPVTPDEVRDRIEALDSQWIQNLDVVQFSPMTRKRALFPCYGMQWGSTVYLYPIEESLIETYTRPPRPEQQIEAKMYGGKWRQDGNLWTLSWTPETIRDFYLNNVLIHEIGHINDDRNTNFDDRERYANWFAIEYGYRATRSATKAK